MPLSEQQIAPFADEHARQIPFDTSPRHLAGPADARQVTHGLAAAGWKSTSDPLSAEIVLRSPDQRYHLQFDPQSTTSAWWRLRAEPTNGEPGWYAEFGERVPAEVLAGLTDASSPARRPSRRAPCPCWKLRDGLSTAEGLRTATHQGARCNACPRAARARCPGATRSESLGTLRSATARPASAKAPTCGTPPSTP
ncbi:DUF317 domain-containing protein [Streptomyces sp. SID1121]|uniref:DUF317 domain-containing protein n=1 Tax=Streptomyces sp. SID1121 TaxID=3425888 RepID=UPI004055AA05